jgi:Rieske Fe-S protein
MNVSTDGQDGSQQPPSRREVVDVLLTCSLGLTGAAALYPAAAFLVPPEGGEPKASTVLLPFTAEELKPNEGRIFKFGSEPGLVIKTPGGEVRAFSARCTHLSCIVQYSAKQSQILCACHAGWYDLTGRNVSGPPPRPLDVFVTNLRRRKEGDGHEIHVSRA